MDVGKNVVLRDWQKAELTKIYDNPAGTRMGILSFAKKNAKSSLSAFILLLHLCGPESIPNSQLVSTAQSKEQAAVLFALAAKVVRLSSTLYPVLTIRDTIKEIFCPRRGTLYKALSAEAVTAHGKSAIFAVHDELGQVRGPTSTLFNAVENAMGAHERPLSIVISTQAPQDSDLLSLLIDDALSGQDPRVTIGLYTADLEIDAFSEEAIRQANPAFGDFLNADEVLNQAARAKRMPSEEALYRNYTLNQRIEAKSPFVSKAVWDANIGDPRVNLDGEEVFGGLDLSAVNDLTSLELISAQRDHWHVKSRFWIPEDGLRERARKDKVPYDVWAKEGFLIATPGAAIDFSYVAKEMRVVFDTYRVRAIAYDRWGWKFFKPWLELEGFSEAELAKFVEFGQGVQSMGPAINDFERLLQNHKIEHGGHPVLNMCAGNAIIKRDPAGNRKFDKSKATGRIDGMVALAMAIGSIPNEVPVKPKPTYQMFFVGKS